MTDSDALYGPYLRGYPVDGVAISTLGGPFGGETVAASDDTATRLDEIQLDLGEGPCWDAVRDTAPVSVPDTASEARWPLFSDAVAAIDIRSVFAFPLSIAGLSIGAIDLYSRRPRSLSRAELNGITASSAATALLVLAAVLRDGEEAENDESSNPRSRREVHQATGMIIARYRTSPEEAHLLLRAHAFAQRRAVIDVAKDIVSQHDGFPDRPLTTEDEEW
ncbi:MULTISPECIES: GAF and ANTAR domain-containing protein [unclassified Rathayibacter]|uniref:GAF and ANTAR domain-containing protein n=1 Tax=unclassified Rathayibacter TaxID=2609250 RepID=UPI00188A705D|nr:MULTISPECIES: GAF and ANTAR domain-containing protein [unclassified Rathayibacter]MBF4463025.1 GAF and ANTAR domain-containing protein [Rathayibacter sp. VKM Ac-2879]MBF4504738.1 GAF and ANTAR domain-containing protein [Rathayibacter sp. VKM Ac-2878]